MKTLHFLRDLNVPCFEIECFVDLPKMQKKTRQRLFQIFQMSLELCLSNQFF